MCVTFLAIVVAKNNFWCCSRGFEIIELVFLVSDNYFRGLSTGTMAPAGIRYQKIFSRNFAIYHLPILSFLNAEPCYSKKIDFPSSLFNARVFACEHIPIATSHSNRLSYTNVFLGRPLLLRPSIIPSAVFGRIVYRTSVNRFVHGSNYVGSERVNFTLWPFNDCNLLQIHASVESINFRTIVWKSSICISTENVHRLKNMSLEKYTMPRLNLERRRMKF